MADRYFDPGFGLLPAEGRISINLLMKATEENDFKGVERILLSSGLPRSTKKISSYKVLQLALQEQNSDIAMILIWAGCEVNHTLGPDRKSSTPLFLAVKYSDEPVVQMLLERKAKVDIKDAATGMTPIQLAATQKNAHILRMLMNADVDNYSDSNIVDVLQTMVEIYGLDIEVAMQKLIHDGIPLTKRNTNEETILHVTARLKLKAILPILLQEKLISVNERDIGGNTVLHTLLNTYEEKGWDESVVSDLIQALLVNYDADLGARNIFGQTAITTDDTIEMELLNVLLLNRASLGLRNAASVTAIWLAICNAKFELALVLSKHCGNLSSYNDKEGNNLLHTLATFSNGNETKLLKVLVSKGVSFNAENKDGQTPISIALRMNNPNIALLLLQYSTPADLKFRDSEGNSLLHYFTQYTDLTDIELLKLLLLKGDCSVDQCNKQDETPFNVAVERNKLAASYVMISDYETELKALKETMLGTNVSLFELLHMNRKELSTYAKNGILQNIVDDKEFNVKFKVFGDMIQSCFQRGVTKRQRVNEPKEKRKMKRKERRTTKSTYSDSDD